MEGIMRKYQVDKDGVKIDVTISRADGVHEIPPYRGEKRERNRRAVEAVINWPTDGLTQGGIIKVFTGQSVCRPPDKFVEKTGMLMALKDAVRMLLEGDLVAKDKKGDVAEVIFDGFRNYTYYKEKAKKDAKKLAAASAAPVTA